MLNSKKKRSAITAQAVAETTIVWTDSLADSLVDKGLGVDAFLIKELLLRVQTGNGDRRSRMPGGGDANNCQ